MNTTKLACGKVVQGYVLDSFLGSGSTGRVFAVHPEDGGDTASDASYPLALKMGCPDSRPPRPPRFTLGQSSRRRVCLTRAVVINTGDSSCAYIPSEWLDDLLRGEFSFLLGDNSGLFPKAFRMINSAPCGFLMERIPGKDLRRCWRENGITTTTCLKALKNLLTALAARNGRLPTLPDGRMHHGDLKPENIIVNPTDETFRLIDPAQDVNGYGHTMTPAYNPLDLDGEYADTLAIATIVVETITSRNPFSTLSRPLIDNHFSGIRPLPLQEEWAIAMRSFSPLRGVLRRLPRQLRSQVQDWFITPRPYEQQLQEWAPIEEIA